MDLLESAGNVVHIGGCSEEKTLFQPSTLFIAYYFTIRTIHFSEIEGFARLG